MLLENLHWCLNVSGPSFLTEDDIPGSLLDGRDANRSKIFVKVSWRNFVSGKC